MSESGGSPTDALVDRLPPTFLAPRYDAEGLAGVLPAVVNSLGPDGGSGPLPSARRAVVVLVDGLGDDLLRERRGHAPFLRSLLPSARRLTAGFPSTTATSLGSFGTGLPPGSHGLVGYQVLVPERDAVMNELAFDVPVDPLRWQPHPTVFERAVAAGISVTRVAPRHFDGSGLTRAALRGGRFVAAHSLQDRVDASVAAVRAARRALVQLYWGDLDKVGHVHGCRSALWGEELERVDAALRQLGERLPPDTALYVTGDHGMVDVPFERRLDLAADPELARGVRHFGGEARGPQLYCEPGAAPDVVATWAARLGESALVLTRDEVVAFGWFGPVHPGVLPRIGDVVVPMVQDAAVVDSRTMRPEVLALLGQHGSLTSAEMAVPLLCLSPRNGA